MRLVCTTRLCKPGTSIQDNRAKLRKILTLPQPPPLPPRKKYKWFSSSLDHFKVLSTSPGFAAVPEQLFDQTDRTANYFSATSYVLVIIAQWECMR
jgi:hypothetical protein